MAMDDIHRRARIPPSRNLESVITRRLVDIPIFVFDFDSHRNITALLS
jgi:hypothetical protein